MRIQVRFFGQAGAAAGRSGDELECESATSVSRALTLLADKFGTELRRTLLDERGAAQPSLMIFLNDEQVLDVEKTALRDGDELTIVPPISGG